MSKADGKKAIFARIDSGVADALSKTAARLGTTGSKYVEQAIVRCVAQDADKVSLANSQHDAEVERRRGQSPHIPRIGVRPHEEGGLVAVSKVRILRLDAATDKTLTRAAAIENRDAEDIAADVLAKHIAETFDRDGHRVKTASLSASDDPDVDRLVKLANGLRGVE